MDGEKIPAKWYIGHVLFGVISGLICYFKYRKKDVDAGNHLMLSMVIHFVMTIIWVVVLYNAGLFHQTSW